MSTVQIPVSMGGTNVPYNDGTGAYGMESNSGYGYKTYLIPMLSEVISACAVAVAAGAAATNAQNVNGTSTSSVTVGTGTKTFTFAEADRAIVLGMWLSVANTANPANFMHGQVTGWNAGTRAVTINATKTGGTGTLNAWSISLSGPAGTDGSSGGETLTSLGTLINSATAKATPVDADQLPLMDSAASNITKKLSWANLKAAVWAALGALIAGGTPKTTPTGADEVGIADSAASNASKRLSLTNLAAWLAALTQTLTNKSLTNPTITNYTEGYYAPAAGSSFTVDLSNGTEQLLTTNGNATITLPTAVNGKSYTIIVKYGGTHTVSFTGGSLVWTGNTAPAATSVNGKRDIYVFTCADGVTIGRSGGSNA